MFFNTWKTWQSDEHFQQTKLITIIIYIVYNSNNYKRRKQVVNVYFLTVELISSETSYSLSLYWNNWHDPQPIELIFASTEFSGSGFLGKLFETTSTISTKLASAIVEWKYIGCLKKIIHFNYVHLKLW